MTTNTVKMLTINQAAEVVPGLTKYRIREMCIKGELLCIKAGKKYLICESVLIRFLTEGAQHINVQEKP
jgi:hypothetical protein